MVTELSRLFFFLLQIFEQILSYFYQGLVVIISEYKVITQLYINILYPVKKLKLASIK
jgi:hypothetical protein